MNDNNNYNLPLDYYIIKYLETNTDIKHYWSLNNFFINGSNNNMIKSTVQNNQLFILLINSINLFSHISYVKLSNIYFLGL